MCPKAEPFVVANFNLHAGVDGWGRPFDVVDACRALGADVIVLEETWAPDGAPSLAHAVGSTLGYTVTEHPLADGRLAGPHPRADHRWMRPLDWRGSSHAIYLDGNRPFGARVTRSTRYREAKPGSWGIAVLSRFPVVDRHVIELGRLRRDRARRAALLVRIDVGDRVLTVVGTHMSHLSYGSPLHFRRLHRLLEVEVGPDPAVLAGDMNLWGPPVGAFFPGWRRVVRAKTWPAWSPHSQVDHILVRGGVDLLGGEALPMAGSDHRPVRARLTLP
jgi:endonuclease/exonuclease/phosphatase family metal-dependent hydrolase